MHATFQPNPCLHVCTGTCSVHAHMEVFIGLFCLINEACLRVVMKLEKYFHTKIGMYPTYRTILCVHMCTGAYSVHAHMAIYNGSHSHWLTKEAYLRVVMKIRK